MLVVLSRLLAAGGCLVSRVVACLAGMVRSSNIHIFAGGRVSKRKPSPDIYNLAKRSLRVDAADCLVIEDDEVRLAPALSPPPPHCR